MVHLGVRNRASSTVLPFESVNSLFMDKSHNLRVGCGYVPSVSRDAVKMFDVCVYRVCLVYICWEKKKQTIMLT